MTLEINKVGSILVASKKRPESCSHHWHRRPEDGLEREVKTVGVARVDGVCCHCGARAHIPAGRMDCGPHAPNEPAAEDQGACCVRPSS